MRAPTPFRPQTSALSFRLGSIPVRVDPWLLLLSAMIGLGVGRGPLGVAAAAASLLATVFAHELAHAVAIRSFGGTATVHFTLFRNTLGDRIASLPAIARTLASLAGPAASLCLGVAVIAGARMHTPASEVGAGALRYFGFINVAWGLLNVLPILPLDGGHALVALLDRATKGRGEQPVRWISLGGAVALGVAAAHARAVLPLFICGICAVQNARALQTSSERNHEAILRVHLQAAFDAAGRGDAALAINHCRTILTGSRDRATRRDAVRLLTYAYATSDDWRNLVDLLESGGATALGEGELEKYQRAAGELGRSDEARRIGSLRGLVGLAGMESSGATGG
jgi:Zn-dependent protease